MPRKWIVVRAVGADGLREVLQGFETNGIHLVDIFHVGSDSFVVVGYEPRDD